MSRPEYPAVRHLLRAAVVAAACMTPVAAFAAEVVEEARAAAAAGDHAGALAALDARLQQDPQDREARFARAQVLAWSGDYAASRAAYDALLAEEPRNADYLLGRAQAWLWDDEPRRALEDIRAARAIAPDYAPLAKLEQQALAALPAPATAAAPARQARRGEASAEAGWESLDRGLDDWRSLAARIRVEATSALELRGSIEDISRYGRQDQQGSLGAGWAIAGGWTVGADVGASAQSRFLPEWTAQAQLGRRIGSATSLQATYRRSEYRNTRGETFSLAAEHYLSRYRLAYALFRGEPADARPAWTHVLRADVYYGETGSVGLQFTTGEESESDGAGGLIVSRVKGVALIGRHALAPDWALHWAATWHEQGDLYRRAGANVGIARRF